MKITLEGKVAQVAVFLLAPDLLKMAEDYLKLLESDYIGTGNKDYSNGKIAELKYLIAKAKGEKGL